MVLTHVREVGDSDQSGDGRHVSGFMWREADRIAGRSGVESERQKSKCSERWSIYVLRRGKLQEEKVGSKGRKSG